MVEGCPLCPDCRVGTRTSRRRDVAGVYVALGGVGKGLVLLELALKVMRPKERATSSRLDASNGGIDLCDGPRAFGGEVCTSGNAVVIAAEDDRDELHRQAK